MTNKAPVEVVVPSNPADREAIAAVIKEISNSMTRQEGEKEYVKEAIAGLSEKYSLPKQYLRRIAREYHKDLFEKAEVENENYGELRDAIPL